MIPRWQPILAAVAVAAMVAPAGAEDAAPPAPAPAAAAPPAAHGGDAGAPPAPAAAAPADDAPVAHDHAPAVHGPALLWRPTATAGPPRPAPPVAPQLAPHVTPSPVPTAPRNAVGAVMPPRPPGGAARVGVAAPAGTTAAIATHPPIPAPPLSHAAINGTAMGQRVPSSPVAIGGPARDRAGVINGTLVKPRY